MAYEMKPMTGVVFFNTEKKNPKHADWKGILKMYDGSEYLVSGYNRNDKNSLTLLLRKKNTPYEKRLSENKSNFGTIEANTKKTTAKHPDYKGKINVDGTEYFLNAWDNIARSSGKKYIKLMLSPIKSKLSKQNETAWKQPKTDSETGFSNLDLDIGVPQNFNDSQSPY